MKRSVLVKILAVLAVVVIIAVAAGIFFLDGIVQTAVEKVGPVVTKVPVKLKAAKISIFGGSGKLEGFVLGNPEGYKTPEAIKVGSVALALAPMSLLSDKVIVRQVHVEGPEITYETDLKGSNLGKILENLQSTGSTANSGSTTNEQAAAPTRLQVGDFVIKGARVHVSTSVLGGKSATLPLPEIHLTALGTGPEGITPAELSKRVLAAVLDATKKVVAEDAAKLGQGVTDGAKALGTSATDTLKKSGSGITDLFKKKE